MINTDHEKILLILFQGPPPDILHTQEEETCCPGERAENEGIYIQCINTHIHSVYVYTHYVYVCVYIQLWSNVYIHL